MRKLFFHPKSGGGGGGVVPFLVKADILENQHFLWYFNTFFSQTEPSENGSQGR